MPRGALITARRGNRGKGIRRGRDLRAYVTYPRTADPSTVTLRAEARWCSVGALDTAFRPRGSRVVGHGGDGPGVRDGEGVGVCRWDRLGV